MSKIKISARPFNLKLKYPFGISRGSITAAKNVLVTLTYDDIVAFGEASPSYYYGEDQESVIEYIYEFTRNKTVEEYLTNIKHLKDDLNKFSSNNFRRSLPSARVALEMAFWDLIGKIDNKSLYQFFFQDDPFLSNGTSYKNIPVTSYTIGLDNLMIMENKANEAIRLGYKTLKVKVGTGFEQDLNIIKTIGKLVKDNSCVLRVDANGGWDIEVTKKMLDILPNYNVELLEQPLPRGQSRLLALVLDSTKIPIFLDEDCIVSTDIESLAGKVHGINIKLMKAGSILEAYNMITLARSYNLKVMLGCMIESSCGISAAVHLSPLADFVDLDGHLLLDEDPFSGLLLEDNKIIPSFDAGLGVSLVL